MDPKSNQQEIVQLHILRAICLNQNALDQTHACTTALSILRAICLNLHYYGNHALNEWIREQKDKMADAY